MYLFSIECSTQRVGIAVVQGKNLLVKKTWLSRDTSTEILPEIDRMLKKVGLQPEQFDYFVVSTGPGSWTGVRLGLALAYGLAIADEEKVFGLSGLEAMAYQLKNENNVGVFLPSVKNSVHFGFFKNPCSLEKKYGKLSSCAIKQLPEKLKNAQIIAGPDRKICSLFTPRKPFVEIFPDPVLNAMLAFDRIQNSVKPENQPYYEK